MVRFAVHKVPERKKASYPNPKHAGPTSSTLCKDDFGQFGSAELPKILSRGQTSPLVLEMPRLGSWPGAKPPKSH